MRNFWWPTFLLALVQPACHLGHHSGNLRTRPAGVKAALAPWYPRAPAYCAEWEHHPSETSLRRSLSDRRRSQQSLQQLCHPASWGTSSPLHRHMPAKASLFCFFFLKANAARAAWFTVMEWLSKWHRFHMSALACLISELSHSKWLLRRLSIMRGQWVAEFEACAATVSVLLIWVTLPGSKVERPPACAKLWRQTRNKHGLL